MLTDITLSMSEIYKGEIKRINHFLKVFAYTKIIADGEEVDSVTEGILEVAALMHDIGIKYSEQKYGSSEGSLQEIEGPPIARDILQKLNLEADLIDRVCFLIAHHHTYIGIDSIDWQILVEADFLVNLDEKKVGVDEIKMVEAEIFKTTTGKRLLEIILLN